MKQYDHTKIEKKWQKQWAKKKLYKTVELKATDTTEHKKCYILDMFPYPSGEGLHVGHPKGYIATDVYSRFKRMQGFNVLHPMGFDAFGLPAENYAIKNKIHPSIAVAKNIKRYKEQLEIIGFDYDWSREVDTTDPEYYRWTQWIFLQLFKKGLAYESNEPINWCPSCKTGLANEDLEDGKCERCGSVVEKKPIRQWVLRITDYAERLLKDIDGLNWPESIKESQRNWIGRSEGSQIRFTIHDSRVTNKIGEVDVFTTRADTLFGATALVLSPEHPWLTQVTTGQSAPVLENRDEVLRYIVVVKNKTEIERTDAGKEKTGVRLKGVWAINPATKEKIPVFVADYVLADYGTGAVMAVPAHDERDWAFAKKYGLSVRAVVAEDFGKPLSNEQYVEGVVVTGYDMATGKFLGLQWNDGAVWLVGGGKEKGETFEQSAQRELSEETGYEVQEMVPLGAPVYSHYYNDKKNINRRSFAMGYLAIIDTKKQKSARPEAHEKFTPEWYDLETLRTEIKKVGGGVEHWLEILDRAVQAIASHKKGEVYDGKCSVSLGILINSGTFDGLSSLEAGKKITEFVGGKIVIKYKLRDWVFSRQRYWGEPIPLVHCEKCGVVSVPEKDLPVKLPKVKSYEPTGTGESPLASIEKWVNTKCPKCRGKAKRETNTMPQWAGSSWYYLRYMDSKNKKMLVDPKKEKQWAPVDLYVGGTEHATRHLIYARFWHKFLYDIAVVSTTEPFAQLKNQGLIMGEDGRKMSKRFGNVVNPDDVVATYGADTFRVYEMFMGPFEQGISWSTQNMIGSRRFIERVWRLAMDYMDVSAVTQKNSNSADVEILLNKTIKKVGEDIQEFGFNTAISSLMILLNAMEKTSVTKEQIGILLRLLAPFAPHMTEELWLLLGNKKSIHIALWPAFDSTKLVDEKITIIVQINGKVRAQIVVSKDATEEIIKKEAQENPEVTKWLDGQAVKKIIYVPGRVVNIVV